MSNTTLQTGRSRARFPMVSLEFFSDIILPVVLWPWGRLSLRQKQVPRVFPGGKGGRCVRLTILPPSCTAVMKSGNFNFLEPSGPLQACNGTALPLPYLDVQFSPGPWYFLPLRPEHLPILRFPICDTNANSYINSGRKSIVYLKGIFSINISRSSSPFLETFTSPKTSPSPQNP